MADDRDSDGDSDIAAFDADLFAEPPGFRPATPPGSVEEYAREAAHVQAGTPAALTLRLVGRHSLWAHRLWNAGVALARFVDAHKPAVRGRRTLELGGGASLPALLSALNGAECSVATDYPDPSLVASIAKNCAENCPAQVRSGALKAVGFQWGADINTVLDALPDKSRKFDVVFLSDVVPVFFTEHRNLLRSCQEALADGPDSIVYVFFTSHIVKFADRDMSFFTLAEQEFGFSVQRLPDVKATAMFPDDVGDIGIRETVKCFTMKRKIIEG
ncbi:hypothetical protein BDR26DRAFT_809225 [Obelidium mucronatum]|nr:hypothetical protein BDR26DRAFT_809225 [Obelidium mucronatum]